MGTVEGGLVDVVEDADVREEGEVGEGEVGGGGGGGGSRVGAARELAGGAVGWG